jgi:hypothetical protein
MTITKGREYSSFWQSSNDFVGRIVIFIDIIVDRGKRERDNFAVFPIQTAGFWPKYGISLAAGLATNYYKIGFRSQTLLSPISPNDEGCAASHGNLLQATRGTAFVL